MKSKIIFGHPMKCEKELNALKETNGACVVGVTNYGNGDSIAIIVDVFDKSKIDKVNISIDDNMVAEVVEESAVKPNTGWETPQGKSENLVIPDET